MSYEIVTVATSKKGLFNDLINNKYNADITVLGMGKKWLGFTMKYQLVYDYVKNMDDNKVIIFLDGFDSEIKKNPQEAYDSFEKSGYKMLVSSDPANNNLFLKKQMENAFGVCEGNLIANSGMYMGRVQYIKKFLEYSLQQKCKDDQVILNKSCQVFDYIKVDDKGEIFQNIMGNVVNRPDYNDQSVFVSYPLSNNFERLSRGVFEYTQYFLVQIMILYAIIVTLSLLFGKSKNMKFVLIFSTTLFMIIWLINSDYSCVNR